MDSQNSSTTFNISNCTVNIYNFNNPCLVYDVIKNKFDEDFNNFMPFGISPDTPITCSFETKEDLVYFLIDYQDLDIIMGKELFLNSKGYIYCKYFDNVKNKYKLIALHKLIMERKDGKFKVRGTVVDHQDRN